MTLPSAPAAPKGRFQFTLKTLLLLVLVCGGGLGLVARFAYQAFEGELHRRRQIASIIAIEELGGAAFNEDPQMMNTPVILVFLSGSQVTDKDLSNLGPLNQIQELWLENTSITDDGLRRLHTLKELQWLRLGGTPISDAGLANLLKLKALKGLHLDYTHVTDAGASRLAELTDLEYLSLRGTQVSSETIAELQKALPGAIIVR